MSRTTRSLQGNQYLVTHSVGHGQAGIRLDRFLMMRYPYRSRERLKKAVDSGAITVVRHAESKHMTVGALKPSTPLHGGDVVQLLSIRKPEPEVNFNYQIIHEDEHILVINKPAHLPVHPAGKYFFHTLLTHLRTRGFTQEAPQKRDYFLPHRIDKETSGILLLAKTRAACADLVRQFSERTTEKAYLAMVRGNPTENQFSIQNPIGKKKGSIIGLKMYSLTELEGGLTSQTNFTVLETRKNAHDYYSLVACFPKTGRQHQIRVHADIAGYPLVGDKIYGWPEDIVYQWLENSRVHDSDTPVVDSEEDTTAELLEDQDEDFEISSSDLKMLILPRHALHAAGLRFTHPHTQELMTFTTALPEDLSQFFDSLPLVSRRGQFSF